MDPIKRIKPLKTATKLQIEHMGIIDRISTHHKPLADEMAALDFRNPQNRILLRQLDGELASLDVPKIAAERLHNNIKRGAVKVSNMKDIAVQLSSKKDIIRTEPLLLSHCDKLAKMRDIRNMKKNQTQPRMKKPITSHKHKK